MNISGINFESIADGEGVRCTLFIAGCKHDCPGCHSPGTHSFSDGVYVTYELIDKINAEIKKRPFLSGITLSGGDPMYSYDEVCGLLDELIIPNNNIWLYTGFTFEEIKELDKKTRHSIGGCVVHYNPMDLVKRCSVMVDGRYEEDKRDISLPFRGSSNQRIIDIQKTLKKGEIVLYEN